MTLSMRTGNFRPFLGTRSYDDGAAATLQAGFTTYRTNAEDQPIYQTTYLEWGGRSDHLSDAIDQLQGREVPQRLVADATYPDRRYVGSNERNGIDSASDQTVDV